MPPPPRAGGFTLVEAAIVLAILGILAGVGIPSMSNWLLGRKAAAAAGYYADGFAFARNQAIGHNSASRVVLNDHPATGQLEWRVDLCYPNTDDACDDDSKGWSTANAAASGDPRGTAGDKSVTRSANGLPPAASVALKVGPSGANAAYFTALGWVDTRIAPQVGRITLSPKAERAGSFAPVAVSLTLAGIAMRCDPAVAAPDRRRCPR
jgi:type IV fimbrial biogenesis protein FimT